MRWLFIALLNPIFHGGANILDNYISNKLFRRVTTLIFYSAIFELLFLPIVLIFKLPDIPPFRMIPFFIIVGAANILYLYPYYKALQSDDTSIVSSLFELGKIFVPILAFFIVKEVITLHQYIGFFVIVIASTLLAINGGKGFRLNKSFWYMFLVSLLISIEIVIYKYIFLQVNWITGFVWGSLGSTFILALLLLSPSVRTDIKKEAHTFKRVFFIFGTEELLTFAGGAAGTYAISLTSVTLVEAIASSQPFFVLLYALILGKALPKLFKEHIDKKSVFKKIALFTLMIFGVILVTKI